MSSGGMLKSNCMLTLKDFAYGYPSPSHLLKLYILIISFPLLHDIPRTSFAGYLDRMMLEGKGIDTTPYSPSWYGIHNISHAFPEPYFEVATILFKT